MQRYARIAGVLLLLTIVAGGFGEMYAPMKLVVPGDAAMTAANVRNLEPLFRIGFAAYLIEALCDIALAWLFYVLLRPVHEPLALLAAFFGIASTALFGFAELFYFCSSLVLRNAAYLTAFSPAQRNALALLSLKVYDVGGGLFLSFYGVPTAVRGWLIFRSTYLPKFLGVLFMLAGAGFIVQNFLIVLAPKAASPLLLLPMMVAVVCAAAWFLTKGVGPAATSRVSPAAVSP